jgi:hypothetical protein
MGDAATSMSSLSVDVFAHVLARSAAIAALEAAGGEPASLPKHLRRRTTSHLQKRAKRPRTADSCEDDGAPSRAKRRRHDQRRAAWSLESEASLAATGAGAAQCASARWRLVTHDWHAKRFTMGSPPGWGRFIVPFARRDVAVRASLAWWWRSAVAPGAAAPPVPPSPSCVVHDASYWITFRLTGPMAEIVTTLEAVLDPYQTQPISSAPASSSSSSSGGDVDLTPAQRARRRRFTARTSWRNSQRATDSTALLVWPESSALSPCSLSGSVAVRAWLYARGAFPGGAISPVVIHWIPSSGEAKSRTCILLVHAAAVKAAATAVTEVAPAQVAFTIESRISRFSLWGGGAAQAADAATKTTSVSREAPRYASAATVTYSKGSLKSASSGSPASGLAESLWGLPSTSSPPSGGVKLAREDVDGPKPQSDDDAITLVMAWGGDKVRPRIDIVVPQCDSRRMWGRVVCSGKAAAVGLREWRAIHTAARVPHFPGDACGTSAGAAWAAGRVVSEIASGRARGQSRARDIASTATAADWSSLWPGASAMPSVVRRKSLVRGVLAACAGASAVSLRHPTLVIFAFEYSARGRPPPAGAPILINGTVAGFVLSAIHSPASGGRATGLAAVRAEAAATLQKAEGSKGKAAVGSCPLNLVALVDDHGA